MSTRTHLANSMSVCVGATWTQKEASRARAVQSLGTALLSLKDRVYFGEPAPEEEGAFSVVTALRPPASPAVGIWMRRSGSQRENHLLEVTPRLARSELGLASLLLHEHRPFHEGRHPSPRLSVQSWVSRSNPFLGFLPDGEVTVLGPAQPQLALGIRLPQRALPQTSLHTWIPNQASPLPCRSLTPSGFPIFYELNPFHHLQRGAVAPARDVQETLYVWVPLTGAIFLLLSVFFSCFVMYTTRARLAKCKRC